MVVHDPFNFGKDFEMFRCRVEAAHPAFGANPQFSGEVFGKRHHQIRGHSLVARVGFKRLRVTLGSIAYHLVDPSARCCHEHISGLGYGNINNVVVADALRISWLAAVKLKPDAIHRSGVVFDEQQTVGGAQIHMPAPAICNKAHP